MSKSGSGKKSVSTHSGDAGDKDRIIAGLKGRLSILEKELRLQQEEATSRGMRMQAERWLRESQEKYKAIFDKAAIGIAITDPDGHILECNPAYQDLVGYNKEELREKCFVDFMHPDDRDTNLALQQLLAEGWNEKYRLEKRYIRKDGKVIWVRLTTSAIHEPDGSLKNNLIVVEDITARKRAEDAHRESEGRLWAFLENSKVIAWMKDDDGRYVYMSQNFNRRFYTRPRDWHGRTDFELWPREIAEKFRKNDLAVLEGGRSIEVVEEAADPDGSKSWWLSSKFPFQDTSGKRYVGGLAVDITERLRSEMALKESEEKYRRIVETTNEGIWIVDRDTRTTFVNDKMASILGYTAEEMFGRKIEDFCSDPDLPLLHSSLDTHLGGVKVRHDIRFQRKDGSCLWCIVSATPILNDKGDFAGGVAMITDITDRKQAEEVIVHSGQMLQLIMDNIPQAIFWKDRNSKYIGCNKVFARATGLETSRDIRGKTDYDLPWSREQADAFRENDRKVLENDMPEYHIVEQQREASGRVAWVETNKIPLHDSQGNVTGILGTYEDITERKWAEEALHRSEEGLKKSQEIAHLGNWELDLVNNKLTWSDEVYRIFGLQPQEFGATYEAFLEVVHPDDRAAVHAAYSDSIREGRDSYEIEHRVVRRSDGDLRVVYEKCEHIRDKSGRIIRSMGMVHDITERKQIEEALMEAKSQAELYLDLMGHDINNMHQVALGYLELARDMHPVAGRSEFLDKPIEVLQRGAQLIQNVRKLRKLKDGVFQTQEVDMCVVLRDVQREFGAVPNKAITLSTNGHEHCLIHANELLHDVFANLVSNAIKHTGDHADIIIDMDTVKENGREYCRVKVEDDGPGIPDDFKGKIFNRMLRGSTKAKGMGLGLYLVKSLVDSYGGRVWVEDRIQGDHTKGARFVVVLPAVEK